jgi:hypothetical protein
MNYGPDNKAISFGQSADGTWTWQVNSQRYISTLVGLTEKPVPELFFNTNKGKLRVIDQWKNGADIASSWWPVEAGVLGLKPSPSNEFYRYLVDNVEFYGDADGGSKTSH